MTHDSKFNSVLSINSIFHINNNNNNNNNNNKEPVALLDKLKSKVYFYDSNNTSTIKTINHFTSDLRTGKNDLSDNITNNNNTKVVENKIKTPTFRKINNKSNIANKRCENVEEFQLDTKSSTSKPVLTLKDYETMKFEDLILYDKRSFVTYFIQTFMIEHSILEIIFIRSLLIPKLIRILLLFSCFSIDFTLNAVFYSDDYISSKYTNSRVNNNNDNTNVDSFFYVLTTQLAKSIWSIVISSLLTTLIQCLHKPKAEFEMLLTKAIKTKNVEMIEATK